MTERYAGFYVILEKDIREDDAKATISAMRHIKGVLSVEPKVTDNFDGLMIRHRFIREMEDGIFEMMKKLK